MKTYREFIRELKTRLPEDAPANAVSGGNIAGISDVPPNDPPVFLNKRKKKKTKMFSRHVRDE